MQGIVYELEFSDGSLTGWVLKADAGNVTAKAMPPMVLEWALGRALMKAMGRAREGPVSPCLFCSLQSQLTRLQRLIQHFGSFMVQAVPTKWLTMPLQRRFASQEVVNL